MAVLEDSGRWSEVVPAQAAQWIFDTERIARLILSEGAGTSDRSLAWIRLYAIVSELPNFFLAYKKLNGFEANDLAMRTHLALGINMATLIDKVVCQFSADEMVMLEYMRNCQAHPFQNGYRLSLKVDADGKIINKNFQKNGISKLEICLVRARSARSAPEFKSTRCLKAAAPVPSDSFSGSLLFV